MLLQYVDAESETHAKNVLASECLLRARRITMSLQTGTYRTCLQVDGTTWFPQNRVKTQLRAMSTPPDELSSPKALPQDP